MRTNTMRCAVAAMAAFVLLAGGAVAAGAATITSPTGPYNVPRVDDAGNPDYFTVSASGYSPGQAVFVEQCDGVSPSASQYTPAEHCDAASGQSPVFADGSGNVTFLATDSNRRLIPFKGESPQSLFNCNAVGEIGPSNGLPNFTNCQVRVASQTGASTTDQAYITIALPAAVTGPTSIGGCGGAVMLGSLTPAITDQTQLGVTAKTKVLKNLTTKAAIGGTCATAVRPGDPIQPAGGAVSFTVKSIAAKLVGNATCAQGATATAADAAAAAQWPLNGKITYTGTTTNALGKPWQVQADIAALGFSSDPTKPDVLNVGGVVLKGAAVGATVGGSIWFDPVAKTGGPAGYNTGYELDLASASGCADGSPNNATISTVMIGGGGGSTTSLLGSAADGLTFSLG